MHRDPRWSKEEERALLRLDGELDAGKLKQRYKKMGAAIGRSPQACRQKLLHLKENARVISREVNTTKRPNWTRMAKAKMKSERKDENTVSGANDKDASSATTVRHLTRQIQGLRALKAEPASPPAGVFEDSDATVSDVDLSSKLCRSRIARLQSNLSETTRSFLKTVRSTIHHALVEHGIVNGFYTSIMTIEAGWDVFVASDIPHAQKNNIVAPLIGDWLEGLGDEAFELEVDSVIANIVQALSEWDFEGEGESSGENESSEESIDDEDSGYEADDGDEMELDE